MGEGIGNDELIMPFISSANIACGYHAGDEKTMEKTIELCIKYDVAIGAHPSFLDRENFGRIDMELPLEEIYDLLTQQLFILNEVADSFDRKIGHVKPHGALYNLSVENPGVARIIALAVREFDAGLILVGLSGSPSITEAEAMGLRTASEVFADRTYQEDGSLTPRSEPGALIENTDHAVQQALQMIKEGTVTTMTGEVIPVVAETICVHGDGKHAVEFVKQIQEGLKKENIRIVKR